MSELFAKRTLIGFVLKVVGLAVIGWGIIQGFIYIVSFGESFMGGMGIFSFLNTIVTYSICGILIIGFGEVIDLLRKIHDQNDPKLQVAPSIAPVPLSAEQEIKEFYKNQNIWIDSISSTKHATVFIVKANDRIKYIELGGTMPKILSEDEVAKCF
jgi:hypothetical protein